MRAAYGLPKRKFAEGSLEELLINERRSVGRAVADLRRAIFCGFFALAVVTAGVGTTWYGARPGSPGVQITDVKGKVSCGPLIALDSRSMEIRVNGLAKKVPMRDVLAVKAVDECRP
ncbi:hypothetical protein [Streptomyces lydicus]|uniref:hypothetical protein n=1 Tax=Streptomyces lydicus TaxID=47763 RepID=UPI00286FC55F|nr:hypothetical protein [Streptomyces lydicus]